MLGRVEPTTAEARQESVTADYAVWHGAALLGLGTACAGNRAAAGPRAGNGSNARDTGRSADAHQLALSANSGPSPGHDHRITSSARTNSDCGIVMPSTLAVLRLITSSNFAGRSMGKLAGLAPLRILWM